MDGHGITCVLIFLPAILNAVPIRNPCPFGAVKDSQGYSRTCAPYLGEHCPINSYCHRARGGFCCKKIATPCDFGEPSGDHCGAKYHATCPRGYSCQPNPEVELDWGICCPDKVSLKCEFGQPSSEVCNKQRGPACSSGYTCISNQQDAEGICCPKKELTEPLQCTSGKPIPNTKCAGVQNLPCPRHHYCVTPDTWAKELGVCCPSTRLLHRTYIDPADVPTNTQSSSTPNDGFSSKSKLLKDTYSFELKQLTDAYYSRWKQLSEAYASGLNQTIDSQSNKSKPLTGGFASKTSKPKQPNDVVIKRGSFSTSPKRSNTNFLSKWKQTSDTSSSKPIISTSTYSPKSSLTKSNYLSKWKQTRDAYSSKPSLNNDLSKLKSRNTNYLSKRKQTSEAYSSKANLNNDPAKLKSTNTNYLSKWKQTSGSYSSKRSGSNDAYFSKPKLKGGGRSLPSVRSSGGSPVKPKQSTDVHSAKQNQAPAVHFPKKPKRTNVGHSSKPKQTHAIHFPKPKPVSGAFLSNTKQATKDFSSLSSPVAVRFSSLPQPSAEPYLPKKADRWSSKTMPDFLTGKDVVFLDKKKQNKKVQKPSIKLLGNQQEQNAGGLAAQLGLGLTSRVDNTKSGSPQLSIDLPPRVDKTTSLFQMFVHQLLEKALTNTKHSQQHSQTERPKMAQQKSLKILTLNDNPQNKLTNGRKEELIHRKVAYDISTTEHKPQKKLQNKRKNIKQKGAQTKQSKKQATKSNSTGRKVPKPKAEKQQSKGKSNKGKPKAQTQKPKGNKGTKAQKGRAADPREVEAEERVPNPGQTTTTTTAAPTAPTTAEPPDLPDPGEYEPWYYYF